jgi:HD-like signal output (HDOD) protein
MTGPELPIAKRMNERVKVINMGHTGIYQDDEVVSSAKMFSGAPTFAFADPLPNIPVTAMTRLQLDLLLSGRSINLSAVGEVILSDAGATLQMLRLIGEEYRDQTDRPTSIEGCIISLDADRWYDAVCAAGIAYNNDTVLLEWQRLRRVARCAREIARGMYGFSPEEAYMVGLLHNLGSFPHLLGWKNGASSPVEQHALGVMLAEYWNLPAYLVDAISEQQQTVENESQWASILQLAHDMAVQLENSSNR